MYNFTIDLDRLNKERQAHGCRRVTPEDFKVAKIRFPDEFGARELGDLLVNERMRNVQPSKPVIDPPSPVVLADPLVIEAAEALECKLAALKDAEKYLEVAKHNLRIKTHEAQMRAESRSRIIQAVQEEALG